MVKVTVGGKSLDNIAISMYKDARIIFREYIQNATDAIDDAVRSGALQEGEGIINIDIDKDARRITIEDNGIGVSVLKFKSTLIDIGNSDKKLENNRGYRGIGRFCSLGYCKTLVFTSTLKGENKLSTMIFDAKKLQDMINDDEKYTAEIILNSSVTFSENTVADDEHFFRVELIDVTNDDLIDVAGIRDYLSFVAPVEYRNTFSFRQQIYTHAAELNFKITEYKIYVNGEQLVKNYTDEFTTKSGKDKIFDIDFRNFRDADDNLIAWSWIGLSTFKGIIQQTKAHPNLMRGIRLRQGNIQIGDDNVFQNRRLFTEDRGTTYFIGEIYAVNTNLKPNSQRDYFTDNDALKIFEEKLSEYFKELSGLVRHASDVRSAFKAINEPEAFEQKIKTHTLAYQETHKAEHDAEIDRLLDKAAEKEKLINKARRAAKDNPTEISSRVFEKIAKEISPVINPKPTPPRSCRLSLGRTKQKIFTKIFTKLFLPIRRLKVRLYSTRLTRSLPNEPPRFVIGARLQK